MQVLRIGAAEQITEQEPVLPYSSVPFSPQEDPQHSACVYDAQGQLVTAGSAAALALPSVHSSAAHLV